MSGGVELAYFKRLVVSRTKAAPFFAAAKKAMVNVQDDVRSRPEVRVVETNQTAIIVVDSQVARLFLSFEVAASRTEALLFVQCTVYAARRGYYSPRRDSIARLLCGTQLSQIF